MGNPNFVAPDRWRLKMRLFISKILAEFRQ